MVSDVEKQTEATLVHHLSAMIVSMIFSVTTRRIPFSSPLTVLFVDWLDCARSLRR